MFTEKASGARDDRPELARTMMNEGTLPVRDIARRMGVSVATLCRHTGKRRRPAAPATIEPAAVHG